MWRGSSKIKNRIFDFWILKKHFWNSVLSAVNINKWREVHKMSTFVNTKNCVIVVYEWPLISKKLRAFSPKAFYGRILSRKTNFRFFRLWCHRPWSLILHCKLRKFVLCFSWVTPEDFATSASFLCFDD